VLSGVRIVYDECAGLNRSVAVTPTTWTSFTVNLGDGQNWTQTYMLRINYTGFWEVQFLLFKDRDFSSAYREVHLYVRVT